MYHEYPYTTYYHDIDRMMAACHGAGLRLETHGDYLRLVKDDGTVVSSVQVTYADTALTDKDNKPIEAYLFSTSVSGNKLVFVHGDNSTTTIEIPYAESAKEDIQGKNLIDYVYGLSVSGDKIAVTKGDATIYEIQVPYAVKATTDEFNKAIDTYAASLELDGTDLVLRDSKGRILSSFSNIAYSALSAEVADEAAHAVESDEADHATEADHADVSDDATNAVETVAIVGNNLTFTTYGGQTTTITVPYSVKALNDGLSNEIATTYVHNVIQDSQTGEISFLDAKGNVLASLIPTASVATYDNYNNEIANYIKTIVADNQSDYITVTTGKNVSTTIKVNYSEHAYMDTNDQVIKNTYVTELQCVEDVDDGHYKIVWYNGDIPRAEIGRCEVWAYKAQVDVNEKALTSYVAEVSVDDNDNTKINILDGENNSLNVINGTVTSTPSGTVSASATASGTAVTLTSGTLPSKASDSYTAPSWTYNSGSKTLEYNSGSFTEGAFTAGTFPAIDTVTDPSISVTATFSGTQSTDNVDFND